MRHHIYFWVTGTNGRGVLTTAGPYDTEEEAAEETEHLTQRRFHALDTRDHMKARRLLRQRLKQGDHSRPPVDRPEPVERGRSIIDRIRERIRQRGDDDDFDEDR